MMWRYRYRLVIDVFDRLNRLVLKSMSDEDAGRLFKALMDIDPFPDAQEIFAESDDPAYEKITEAPSGDESWYGLWKRLTKASLKENYEKWRIEDMIRDLADKAQLHL